MADLIFKIIDGATGWAKDRVEAAGRAHASALASAGYRLMRLTKEGIKQRAPGGVPWPQLHPWSRFRVLSQAALGLARARAGGREMTRMSLAEDTKTWPIMSRAVRYQKSGGGPGGEVRVRMGFLTPRVGAFAARIAEGQTVQVTKKMRRAFFLRGIPLVAGSLQFPPRPHIGPVYSRYHAQAVDFVQRRIWAALAGQDPKAIQNF